MGYYIQGPKLGKAAFLVEKHGAQPIPCPGSFSEVPADKALVCVVHNGPFEAAGHAFSEREFEDFKHDGTGRTKEWLLMDAKLCEQLAQ